MCELLKAKKKKIEKKKHFQNNHKTVRNSKEMKALTQQQKQ